MASKLHMIPSDYLIQDTNDFPQLTVYGRSEIKSSSVLDGIGI